MKAKEPYLKIYSLAEYSKLQGKSKETILKLADEGLIRHIKSDDIGGHSYIVELLPTDTKELIDKIENMENLIQAISKHFGIKI
ncbi:hypothetical protein [[Clostridium] colinum]|uniref:hypothetical protein n=1 Tax=[Clostridium] colinum TaxID=36835 RepID=UPI002023CD44|nr:hypothetical protein [[Clostridium] colinum]